MTKNQLRLTNKIFSFLASFLLVFNSFAPSLVYLSNLATPVYAEETVEPTPTDTPAPTEEPVVTEAPAPTEVPTPTESVTPEVTPTEQVTPTVEPTTEVSPTPTEVITPESTPTATPTDTPAPQNPENNQNNSSESNSQSSDSPSQPTATPTQVITPVVSPAISGDLSAIVIENATSSDLAEYDLTSTSSNQSGTLTTDKADYAPTDTAIISGTHFSANTTYSLNVTSSDAPAVDFKTDVTTDADGTFSFAYQLDGTYRPNYAVAILLGSTVISTTTFTDSPSCQNDVEGVNDEPGQKDLTRMCIDNANEPTSTGVNWNWDEIYGGGNNTYDGCSLWDSDGDGKANYALCVSVLANPGTDIVEFSGTSLYSCGDDKSDRCSQTVTTLSPSANTTCSTSQQNSDPFTGGAATPSDTQATCNVQPSDIGGVNSILLDVCSFPSGQPNSDPSDCIKATNEQTAKLEIIKSLVPTTDSGLFDLSIDGSVLASGIGNNGSTGEQTVLASAGAGTAHSFSESASGITSLSNYTTAVVCRDNNGTGSVISTSGSNPWSINVVKDKDIVCTITNTLRTGSLQVNKNVDLNGDGDYTDQGETGATNWTWDISAGEQNIATGQSRTLSAGTYTISEDNQTNYHLVGWSCSDNTSGTSNSIPATVTASGSLTCTFNNARDTGTVIVHKDVLNPDGNATTDSTTFNVLLDGGNSQPITDGNTVSYSNVSTGAHTIAEDTLPAGYTLDSITNSGNITVTSGDNHVYIVNRQSAATLTVEKVVKDPQGNVITDDFTHFTANVSTQSGEIYQGHNAVFTLNPSTYSVTESANSDYDLLGCKLPSGADATDFILAPADSLTVTCTNQQKPATITVHKNVLAADETTDVTDNNTFSVTLNSELKDFSENSSAVFSVNPGNYAAVESAETNYTFVSNSGAVSVGSNDTADIYIVNKQNPGSITGFKYDATSGLGIEGWTIYLTGDKNDFAITDATGFYQFLGLNTGSYTVTEDTSDTNWKATTPEFVDFTVTPGSTTSADFTNFHILPNISIEKLLSATTNEEILVGETATFTISITNGGNVTLINPIIFDTYDASFMEFLSSSPMAPTTHSSAVTDSADYDGDGNTTELIRDLTWELPVDLAPGETYTLTLDFKALQITIDPALTGNEAYSSACYEQCTEDQQIETPTDNAFVDIDALGSVIGQKFVDVDGDGIWDNGEPTLNGVTINLLNAAGATIATTTTSGDGDYSFADIATGTYTICEVVPTGYVQTYPANSACHEFTITDDGGESGPYNFGNRGMGKITIEKDIVPDSTNFYDFHLSGTLIETKNFSLADGGSTFYNVPAGSYTLYEETDSNFTTTLLCTGDQSATEKFSVDLTVNAGDDLTCSFTNTRKTGNIVITKLIDADDDLNTTDDQTPYQGWVFDVDPDGNDTSDPSLDSTDEDGNTSASSIKTGTYWVSEGMEDNYHILNATCVLGDVKTDHGTATSFGGVTVANNETTYCTFINALDPGTITVEKQTDPSESEQTFDFTLDGDATGAASLVDGDSHTFENLRPGNYSLDESEIKGWDLDNVSCTSNYKKDVTYSEIELEAGEEVTCTFTNVQRGSVVVTKYADYNGDGNLDEGEDKLSGWTMNLMPAQGELLDLLSDATDENGEAQFEDLVLGNYTLSETEQDGWTLTNMTCDSDLLEDRIILNDTDNSHPVSVRAGQTVNCSVFNYPVPELQITKTNDKTGVSLGAGNIITYTLTVTNPSKATLNNVTVTDAAISASLFEYLSASLAPTSTYPFVWNIGTLSPESSFVITYQLKVKDGVTPGTYTNFAYASGNYGEESSLTTEIVSSDVSVGVTNNLSAGSTTQTIGQVLGAATGSSTGWLVISLLLMALGTGIKIYSRKHE